MAINKTTTETKNKIKANSVIALPNRPQIPAEQLKQAFVKPIVDTSNSMIQELDRIVEETNAELEQVQDDITDAIDEHNTNTEATHLDIRQEITDLENDLQEQIDGIDDTLQNHESRIGGLELFAENLETNITEEIEDALEGAVSTHNASELAHPFLQGKIDEAKAIAEGKVSAMSFETKEDLDAWLEIPENVETLIVGTNFYIEDLESPDYWWNGTTLVELSTDKIDLTEYAKSDDLATVATTGSYNDLTNTPTIPTIPDITVNNGSAESGKYISQVAVDETDKHKLVITKADLPQGFSGNYDDLIGAPTIPTKTSDLTNNSGFITSSDLPTLATVATSGSYTDLTDKPTIPTVPTISTNIATDETSDTKTASPKAVKTYVDNAINSLLGGEY